MDGMFGLCNPCTRAELHQQELVQKLYWATQALIFHIFPPWGHLNRARYPATPWVIA